jgi:hypothetical protein
MVSKNGDCGPSYKSGLAFELPLDNPVVCACSDPEEFPDIAAAMDGIELAESTEVVVTVFKKLRREFLMYVIVFIFYVPESCF